MRILGIIHWHTSYHEINNNDDHEKKQQQEKETELRQQESF
jgi:hypothetical protein